MPKKVKSAAGEHRPLLEARKRDTMLMILMRNREAYEEVRTVLQPKHLQVMAGEAALLLWRLLDDFFNQHQAMPARDLLMDDLQQALTAYGDQIEEDEVAELQGMIDEAFDHPEYADDLHRDAAVRTASLLVEDYVSLRTVETIRSSRTTVSDLPLLLTEMCGEAEQARGLVHLEEHGEELFPEGWDRNRPNRLFPTGVDVLDRFLGGGHAPGEVGVFMGPTGGGKSTVTGMAVTRSVRLAHSEFLAGRTDGLKPYVILVSTETPIEEWHVRMLSSLAQVPKPKLARMESLDDLSDADRPAATPDTAYERKLFTDAGEDGGFMSERRRAEHAIHLLREHCLFVNFTGVNRDKRNEAGRGGVRELAARIKAKLRRRGHPAKPWVVWIDHAAALAARIQESKQNQASGDDDRTKLNRILKNMPLECRDHIGMPFSVPVWITHQLSGTANATSPTADLDHTDGDECKAFAWYADHAVVQGRVTDDERQLCKWRCTKHRREPPRQHAVVHLDGDMARVVDVTEQYEVQAALHTFVPRNPPEERQQRRLPTLQEEQGPVAAADEGGAESLVPTTTTQDSSVPLRTMGGGPRFPGVRAVSMVGPSVDV